MSHMSFESDRTATVEKMLLKSGAQLMNVSYLLTCMNQPSAYKVDFGAVALVKVRVRLTLTRGNCSFHTFYLFVIFYLFGVH